MRAPCRTLLVLLRVAICEGGDAVAERMNDRARNLGLAVLEHQALVGPERPAPDRQNVFGPG